jgi:hypothetical protein
MMLHRATQLSFVVLLLAASSGCVTSLAVHAGPSYAAQRGTHLVWGGQLSTQLQAIGTPRSKFLIGFEADARAEVDRGSRWDLGLQIGQSRVPEREPGALGFEWHVDAGSPLHDFSLFPSGDFYFGATAGLRVWLGPSHQSTDLNTAQWLLMRVPELLVYARYRTHVDSAVIGDDRLIAHDFVLGLGVRFLVLSDLIE